MTLESIFAMVGFGLKRTLEKNEVIKIVSGYESIVSGCGSELRYELDQSRQV